MDGTAAGGGALTDDAVPDVHLAGSRVCDIDALLGETGDDDVLNVHLGRVQDADAIEAGAGTIDFKIPQVHDDARRIDDDAVRAGRQHAGKSPGAIDGDRFRDREGSETARVDRVDFSTDRGLADRSCKSLARGGSRAGVGVITDTGNPGSGGLC